MATPKKTTPYDADRRYLVRLKRPIEVAGRRLDPRHEHRVKGSVANDHAEAIESASILPAKE